MGYRGRRGRYPGHGPFRDLPPWRRPGRLYGYGMGYWYTGDPSKCARFPWMPRWWWASPEYEGGLPTPGASTEEQERRFLETQVKGLEEELASMKKRLEELGPSEGEA